MTITIDDVPSASLPFLEKKDDVAYAANLAGGDVMQNYVNAQIEIASTGQSTLVEQQKEKWVQEQVDSNKKTVEELISDGSLPLEQRRKIMETYVQGALPLQDLRRKFLIQSAINDVSTTVADREAQTSYADDVHQRDEQKQKESLFTSASNGIGLIGDILKGSAQVATSLASKILSSIPIGLAAGFELMQTQDPEKASQVLQKIEEWSYNPQGDLPKEALKNIGEWMDTVDIPFKWMGEQALSIPFAYVDQEGKLGITNIGSPELATLVYTAGTMTGYTGIGLEAKNLLRPIKGKPHIPSISPMDTIETASKEQASNVAAKAMADQEKGIAENLGTTKEQILNTYILPKIEEEFGPIQPDAREALNNLDKSLLGVAAETEISPHVYDVTQIKKERDLYTAVLTETERPHLLLSSSVLDISPEAKLYGRAGKDYEAMVESTATKLEGTAIFGRNANYGYKTQAGAEKYKSRLEEATSHLPDQGIFETLERDGQFYISWKFKREYHPHESLVFGDDVLSAHFFAKKIDITDFANGTIGKHIFPAYMRMKGEIPAQGAAAAREEARIESVFLQEARDSFMKTKTPTELEASLRMGEEAGRSFTADEIALQHPHLSRPEAEQLHLEYASYRRIVDHLYNLTDRKFRKILENKEMKSLYDGNGEFVSHVSEPIELPDNVSRVWDLEKKEVVKVDKNLPVVKMNSTIRSGDHILQYAVLPSKWQLGPVRAGALTQIPGYIPRSCKEWFVVDKVPKALWVDGSKVGAEELRNYKQAVAMAGTRKELEALMERFKQEDPESVYEFRKEERDINDKIIHDSKVYDTYLGQIHRRGDRLPSLDRPAAVDDVLVALTKTIRSVAKMTSWDDLTTVRRDNFVKAYGKFTQGRFPDQINEIKPLVHMVAKEEREMLAAQSVYAQMEREQIASIQSDIVWKNGFHKIADVFEKMPVDAGVLRQWGEKGVIPLRAVKALGSNMWLYWRELRMWVVQPQQWKELVVVSPSYSKSLKDIVPAWSGIMSRTHTLKALQPQADALGRRAMQDYDRVINALEESAIMQSVDMNQMVHGIWKDATKELVSKDSKNIFEVIDKAAESVSKGLALPGKVGRAIGYNPSELMNQVSLWLFARHRWMEKNPGKNWDTLENRAQIARDQSLYSHMSSTRAGMFGWQEGMISAFTQFVAIPWKSTLQMISSPQLTGAEKARLAGARLFWYGKYGIPLGAVVYQTLENNLEEKQDRATLAKWTESATDRIWNTTLGMMFDNSGQTTKVDTKNLSTSIDGEYIWNVAHTLYQMGKGESVETPKITFPYENATGSIMETVRTIYDIFQTNNKGPADVETWKAASWKAVSFAGTLSDFNKAMLAEGMSKSGNSTGYQQTRGEAVARLFGVPPSEEGLYNMTTLSQIQRKKEIESTAKQIHQRIISVMNAKSVDEQVKQKEYLDELGSFLNAVPPYYKEEITNEVFKLDRMSWREKKNSLLLNVYKNAADERDVHYQEMRNTLEKSSDPQIKSLLKDMEEMKRRGIK